MKNILRRIKNVSLKTELYVNLMLVVAVTVVVIGIYIEQTTRHDLLDVLPLGFLLIAIAAIIAYFLVRRNIKPIYELADVVEKFGKGDFSKRAEVKNMNEVGRLTEEFNRMADKLQELDTAKSEFISFVSHQYKNPLSSLMLNAEMLLHDEDIKGEQRESAEVILKTAKELNDMVENFLNISKIELGVFKAKKQKTDILELCSDVAGKFARNAKDKNIELIKNCAGAPKYINTDPELLGVVLENLASNAVKYTPDYGKITIEAEKEGEHLVIRVLDTGIGIPKKDQARIFTKFFRGKNAQNGEGTGLGLYMTRVMVKKLGGKIWFDSKEKVGTTFYISLPLK